MTTVEERHLIAAVDVHFQERRAQVPVLAQRAEAEGITTIRSLADAVPLLFPHTSYKSYPEALIANGRWEQMNRWLDSLSTHRVDVDVTGVRDVDDWIDRLTAAGHLVSGSSGTSGKASFLNKSVRDREVSLANLIVCLRGLGLDPEHLWNVVPVGPDTGVAAHTAVRDWIVANYAKPDAIELPASTASGRHHAYMSELAAMRRKMADGTARPDEIAAFEAAAAERQQAMETRLRYFAEQIAARRDERMFFSAMFPNLYRLCEVLEGELGVSEGQLTAANALTCGGGLKGVALPSDYRERIFHMLGIDASRFLHYYSMQELNVRLPKCPEAGRYHVPPQAALLVLDEGGEALAPVSDRQAVGRAGFVDVTVDGRWGGTISGDQVHVDFGACSCGRPGPTIADDITRYSDLGGDGDKITCAGTMDAYVRGFIDD
jgi:hypothetical protein